MQKDLPTAESMRTGRNTACTKLAKLLKAARKIIAMHSPRRALAPPSLFCPVPRPATVCPSFAGIIQRKDA